MGRGRKKAQETMATTKIKSRDTKNYHGVEGKRERRKGSMTIMGISPLLSSPSPHGNLNKGAGTGQDQREDGIAEKGSVGRSVGLGLGLSFLCTCVVSPSLPFRPIPLSHFLPHTLLPFHSQSLIHPFTPLPPSLIPSLPPFLTLSLTPSLTPSSSHSTPSFTH